MVLLIVGVVVGALTPSVVRQITHARVNRAASVVAADFYQAQSLAGRRMSAVYVTFNNTAKTTVITLPPPASTVLLTRRFGPESDFKLETFTATPSTVQVLPSGMANLSVTVTVAGAGHTRQVRMTRAGQIRIL